MYPSLYLSQTSNRYCAGRELLGVVVSWWLISEDVTARRRQGNYQRFQSLTNRYHLGFSAKKESFLLHIFHPFASRGRDTHRWVICTSLPKPNRESLAATSYEVTRPSVGWFFWIYFLWTLVVQNTARVYRKLIWEHNPQVAKESN